MTRLLYCYFSMDSIRRKDGYYATSYFNTFSKFFTDLYLMVPVVEHLAKGQKELCESDSKVKVIERAREGLPE